MAGAALRDKENASRVEKKDAAYPPVPRLPLALLPLLLAALSLSLPLRVASLTRADMVPYGPASGDAALPRCDDCFKAVTLPAPMAFFNGTYAALAASTNGYIGLPSANGGSFDLENWPKPYIALFNFDTDTRPSDGGYVLYRTLSRSSNSTVLSRLTQDVKNLFPTDFEARNFQPDGGFVLSYIDVGYFENETDLVNTFQVWLVWTSSALVSPRTFCCFLYPEDGLQYDIARVAGYDAQDDENYVNLLESIYAGDLPFESNVNVPGKWCFKFSEPSSTPPPRLSKPPPPRLSKPPPPRLLKPPPPRPPTSPPPPTPPPPRPLTTPPSLPPSSEVAALLEFKRAIVYDTFDELSDWKTGIANYSVCDWNGVDCTTTFPKLVNKLSLSGVQLQGTISPSIGSLHALEELDLSNNKFTGSIPDTIGRLQLLKKLILSNNELSGSIPLSFGNLNSLTEMSMSFNNLTGSIPSSFGNLTSLASLNLRNNQLNGSIPASIGTLRSLKLLTLSYNRLTGIIPTSFGGLLAIRQINLASNSLIGPLVFDFGLLEEVSFNFNNNYFSGELSITVNGEARNCVGFDLNCFETTCSPQRDANSCNSFCNARQPQGACGGNGFCSSNGSRPTCSCDVGYNISPDGYTCIFGARGFGLNTTSPLNSSMKLNRYFRYATTGYLRRRSGKASWQVAIAWNWTEEGAVQGIKDQGSCNSCWIFSSISAIESAFFIVNGGKLPIPQLAEQQVLSCSPIGKTCTSGGWPQEALDYAANNALISQSNFTGQASCGKGDNRFKISWFEQAATHGWMGLLLILQQQPAVVNIEASGLTFTNYNGGVFDDEDCFSNGVDHSVVVVGYDLSADPPFWILRNSWGQNWGEQGYMRIKVSAGLGICGINSLPALMPVVKPAVNDPCFRNSYASTVLKTANGPGTMNPCGNGVCIVNGSTNLCDCTEGFVAVTNSDHSQTCAPLSPCTFAASNPCGVGTCLNAVATPGAYACACPLGYAADSPDGILTCVPAAIATGLQYFIVPAGANMSCYDIYILYGISKSVFLAQNMNLNCLLPLPGGTRVNVTNPRNCSVVYAVNEGDTCTAIATYFNVSSIVGPGSPNPDLDCSQLRVFQQVCIQRGALAYAGPCTKSYDVQTDESCFSIIRNQLAGDIRRFYTLNPGVYCGKLMLSTSSSAAIGQKVCLEANDLAAAAGCKGKTYTLQKGDRCASLKSLFAGRETFKKLNGFPCTSGALKKKKIICVSK